MIVGCYSMDLYCDKENCPVVADKDRYWSVQAQFTGRTERGCLREARQDGWRFKVIDGDRKAYCPTCAKPTKKAS
jgi:hypothetical protein